MIFRDLRDRCAFPRSHTIVRLRQAAEEARRLSQRFVDPPFALHRHLLFLMLVFIVTACGGQEQAPEPEVTQPSDGQFTRTNIFLIALEDDGQTGQKIGCDDSVVPVEIEIEPTNAPLTAALERLLGMHDQFYGQSGLYNVFYQSDLSVEGIDIEDGVATVNLSGKLALGGVCDNPRVRAQLEQTILQTSSIESARIFLNGEPLASVLSGQ